MSDFYITLPSNSSMKTYPDNTLTHYFVKLDRPLRLEGKWLVGLVEMHYPNSWDNVTDGRIVVTKKASATANVAFIKTGRYRTVEEILHAIHFQLSTFQNLGKSIRLSWDKVQNLCSVSVSVDDLEIKLSKNISNILGLENRFHGTGVTEGVRQCDISEGFSALYVYSNIVEPQIVGDIQAPLLRIVPIQERSKETNHVESFDHVQYLPLINSGTETIETFIRRDDGSSVPFQSGKVIVTLHLKKA